MRPVNIFKDVQDHTIRIMRMKNGGPIKSTSPDITLKKLGISGRQRKRILKQARKDNKINKSE
jgi:hypothetical protein